jgi:hypothetical protein
MVYFDLSGESYPEEYVFSSDDFTPVTDEEITDQTRWSTHFNQILKYKDGTLWRASWSRGSTEYQDEGIEDLVLVQVEPYQETVTKYKAIN